MDPLVWIAFVGVATVNIVTPGPAILLVVSVGARHGPRGAAVFSLGNILGLACLGSLVALGLAQLLQRSAPSMEVLQWLGAAWLLWLGIKFWRMPSSASNPELPDMSGKSLFLLAFINAVTNPKAMMYLASVLPVFVDPARSYLTQFIILIVTSMGISFISLNLYGSAASRARSWLNRPRVLRVFHRTTGTLLIGFALSTALWRH